MPLQPVQCFGSWMTVVVIPDRDHRCPGPQRIEPFVASASPAPMVADFEKIDRTRPTSHLLFGRKTGITRQEGLEGAVLDEEHQGVLIHILPPVRPVWIRVQDGEADAVQRKPLALSASVPRDGFTRKPIEETIVQRIAHLLARFDHHSRLKPVQHACYTTQVVRVRVGYECDGQLSSPVAQQERNYHAAASVRVVTPWPGIDQYPTTPGCPKEGPISLSYVEKM